MKYDIVTIGVSKKKKKKKKKKPRLISYKIPYEVEMKI